MSQQVENSDILLRSLEPNTNNNNANANRLPLRKRIGPVLKWQPVETPEEHYKQKIPYPQQQQQQYPFSSSSSSLVQEDHIASDNGGDTTETDEEKFSALTSATAISKSLLKKQYTNVKQDGKRIEKEDILANRPTAKKVKRGRPPLHKHADSKSSFQSEASSLPDTPTTPTPPPLPSAPPQNSNLPLRPPADNDTLYCICRRPYDVPRFMIACDKCDQWFHGECIEISEKQGEFIDLYFCENCSKITGKKTSWKPKCANPACSKPARIGTHQGHLSKYCTDTCGMQVARARIELAELKKQNGTTSFNGSPYDEPHAPYNPLSRSKLSSFADLDDRSRLSRVKEEKLHAKAMIAMGEQKSALLNLLIQNAKEDICGFDSRLSWPDTIWEKVHQVVEPEDGDPVLINAGGESITPTKVFSICQQNRKCSKHVNWQKLKASELEQERSEQFVILTMLERERQQIKARMKKRREEVDLVDFLENGTIHHFK